MRRSTLYGALTIAVVSSAASAQGPGGGERMRQPGPGGPMGEMPMHQMMMGPGPGGPAGGGANFLLAATGELKLSDAQVVRLAAISRRAADRHRAMKATMDSLHAQMQRMMPTGPNDTTVRSFHMRAMERMRASMEREHDQQQADLRDAIAVLTPDQQAQAWQMVQHHGAMRGGMGRGGMQRRMMGGPGDMEMHHREIIRMAPDGAHGGPPQGQRPPESRQ